MTKEFFEDLLKVTKIISVELAETYYVGEGCEGSEVKFTDDRGKSFHIESEYWGGDELAAAFRYALRSPDIHDEAIASLHAYAENQLEYI